MDPALIMLLLKAFSYGIVIATVFITMRFIVPSVTRNGVTFTGTAYGSVAAIVLIFFAGSILTNLLLMVLDKLL
ncbi:MAG: hypothetical protein K8F91_08785, partial [Candidatus Obscuribacterales bacterium]|nr:hypothetical protein [Candidatus Obscuribacterales bacterium]